MNSFEGIEEADLCTMMLKPTSVPMPSYEFRWIPPYITVVNDLAVVRPKPIPLVVKTFFEVSLNILKRPPKSSYLIPKPLSDTMVSKKPL